MKTIPPEAKPYKQTPEFTEATIPKGLLKDHQTKAGIWGKIVVLDGKLLYTIQEPHEEILLEPGRDGVVEPTVLHHVQPQGAVRFYVEFYQ